MSEANGRVLVSYLTLRRAVGVLGVLLPLILAIGCFWIYRCSELQPSISDYYGTGMRDVFVGVLFAIGWFLFSYRGHEPQDNVAGDLACFCALGVALFPNTGAGTTAAVVHYVSAAALFITLAYFSFFLFTKSAPNPTPQKLVRNRVYRACGITIVACIVAIGAVQLLPDDSPVRALQPVFWLESIALWAFGFSWFVKGETLWRDPA